MGVINFMLVTPFCFIYEPIFGFYASSHTAIYLGVNEDLRDTISAHTAKP